MNTKFIAIMMLGILTISVMPQAQACNPWDSAINILRNRINNLEQLLLNHINNDTCQTQLDDLQDQIDDLQNQIYLLETEINSLQEQIDSLSDNYDQTILEINARLALLEENCSEIEILYQTIVEIQNDISEIQNTITNMNVTEITVINKYYETYNYDSAIRTINTHITDIEKHLTIFENRENVREELYNQIIVKIQTSLTLLETKVDMNNVNVIKNIQTLKEELNLKILSIETAMKNGDITLQTQIDVLKGNDSFTQLKITALENRVKELGNTQSNLILAVVFLLFALVITIIYFFLKTRDHKYFTSFLK